MAKKKILIVNTASAGHEENADSIKGLLKRTNHKILSYRDIGSFEDVRDYDGIILSGQPVSDRSHSKTSVRKKYPWIKKVNVPMIGFCGGHQIIAVTYGAEVIKNKEAEPKGYFAAYAKGRHLDDPILKGIRFGKYGNTFIVYNKHTDSVTLPEDFKLLAETDRCYNTLMKHRRKPIYGAQFHPDDPDFYRRELGINQGSNQDSDTMVENFERIVVEQSAKC